jgi:predicted enzyme related to lactoylglutathione lyase
MSTTGNPVVHFEIGCKDLEGTTSFYSTLFGWAATPIPYASLLETQSPKGIGGHITALGHEPNQYVTFYIEVEDIDLKLTQVEAAGGKKLVGPVSLPDGKKFAWFSDPGGNMVGLITEK